MQSQQVAVSDNIYPDIHVFYFREETYVKSPTHRGKMSTTEYYYEDYDIVPMTPAIQIPSGIGLAVLIIIGIGGNLMTVVAYFTDRQLNSVYDFYILNLGMTDLLLSCISMPFYAVYTLKEFTWPFGYDFCKVWLIVDFTLCFESIMIMLIVSSDRLLMISMGPNYMLKITKTVAFAQIAISWIVSFLVYSPAIIGWNIWVGYSTVEANDCDVEFAYDHTYTTATSIVEFVLPFVCLTLLNTLIYYRIKQRVRVAPKPAMRHKYESEACQSQTNADGQPSNDNNENAQSTATASTADSKETKLSRLNSNSVASKEGNNVRKTHQRQAKAARFLAMLVIAFLIFWAPYTVTTMAISFCEDCVNISLYEFFNWLLWMKSAVNPFLYAYNSPRYRANFKKYLSLNGRIKFCVKYKKPFNRENATRTTDSKY